jgi:hypothetical protein
MEINMKGYNLDSFQTKDLYTWDEIIEVIEELESNLYEANERLTELERDIEDNYKPISYEEQAGISNRDFI